MIRKALLFCFTCFVLFPSEIKAQETDSLAAERERELLEAVEYDYNIIKLDLFKTFVGGIDIIYERRANLNISLLGEMDWNLTSVRKHFIMGAGIRYYYNLEYRILHRWEKKNKKTSCLSADYFQFDLRAGNRTGEYYDDESLIPRGSFFAPTIKIGFQRKVWKHCFYDLWFGYGIPIPDRRPKDSRIIYVGQIQGGFIFGIGI